jgi:SAM-dependent methyltransferase
VKRRLARLLGRLGVLAPASRVYGRFDYLRARARARGRPAPVAPDGLPLPPPRLVYLVSHTADLGWYLDGGRLAAESLRELLAADCAPIDGVRSLLDFGCGCGRVVRHWRGLAADVHGSDLNAAAITWCELNLPFRFAVNGLAPPLPYEDDAFELVYALSVLTHLPEELQLAWMDELARVLAPGGRLALSTHGERYRDRLDAGERARFDSGELVARRGEVAGSNLCTTFHPPAWVRSRLARGFEVAAHVPEGACGNPHQDLWLLRKAG